MQYIKQKCKVFGMNTAAYGAILIMATIEVFESM